MTSRITDILGLPDEQPLLPRQFRTERPLIVALIIMAFLATLALLAGRQGLRLGAEWQNELYGTASLQVFDVASENQEIIAERITERLSHFTPKLGITQLSQSDMVERLKPWLGSAAETEDLPFPLFFALESESDILSAHIERWLEPLNLDVKVDDHNQWRVEFETVGRALYRTAFLVLALILITSAMIAGFATQSVMSAFSSTLAVIYRSGATRQFVTQLFIQRFFRLSLRGALSGVGAGVIMALLWNGFILRSNESLMQRLSIDFSEIIWLFLLVIAFTLCCTLVSGSIAWRAPKSLRRSS
ncbi:MAG: hypothetical protein ABJ275_11625 [Maricaulaceae bacterium]